MHTTFLHFYKTICKFSHLLKKQVNLSIYIDVYVSSILCIDVSKLLFKIKRKDVSKIFLSIYKCV